MAGNAWLPAVRRTIHYATAFDALVIIASYLSSKTESPYFLDNICVLTIASVGAIFSDSIVYNTIMFPLSLAVINYRWNDTFSGLSSDHMNLKASVFWTSIYITVGAILTVEWAFSLSIRLGKAFRDR